MQYSDKTNSGIIGLVRDPNGNVSHAVVTEHFVDYVRSLIEDYGDQLSPPIKPAKDIPGITPTVDVHGNNLWKCDTEHFDHYQQLSRWRKSNRPKTGAFTKLMEKL